MGAAVHGRRGRDVSACGRAKSYFYHHTFSPLILDTILDPNCIWLTDAENSTSRDDGRQKEQLEAFKIELTAADVEAIAAAGRGKFYRHFQHGVWDGAKP